MANLCKGKPGRLVTASFHSSSFLCFLAWGSIGAYRRRLNTFGIPGPSAGCQEGVANGTPGCLELSCLRRSRREFGRESLSLKRPHRAWFSSPPQSSHFRDSRIYLSADAEASGGRSHSSIGRWHSLSRLPSSDSGALGPTQPLVRRRRSVPEQDLRASLPERVQREAELLAFLKETDQVPKGEMKELRKLEVDLNVMKFELLSLKQRMESSFAVLEKEQKWLETLPSGGRKRKGKRKDRALFDLTVELLKAKSYARRKRDGLLSLDPGQCAEMGKKDVSQDTPALQETLVAQEDSIKALDKERAASAQQLESAREEKDALDPQLEKPPLDLEGARKKPEGSDVDVVALYPDLACGKFQVSQPDREKILLERELESTRQRNKELSLEVAASHQTLEASLDSLRHWEAEKTTLESSIQALENERAQLLREREGKTPKGQLEGPSREEDLQALQVTCENLRESQCLLQREKDVLETRCLELEADLRGQREATERHLAEQKQVSRYWQDRWEQVAAALKTKEEELEKTHLHSQALPAQEAEGEIASVREELQKARDVLKARNAELEEKQLELQTTRSQYEECSSEKQRLGRVIASLEDQLAEKQQALRHLEEAEDEDRTERETKISLLEQKLAEMEAAQGLHGHGSNGALKTREVWENAPADDSRSRETCPRCGAALAQLDQAIQSAIKREKEDQTLACLYRVQDLLKGSISDQVAIPTPPPTQVPSPSRDPSARVLQSPQEEREALRQRHQLVTEQLKGLFRQRQQLEQSQKQAGGGKERPREPPKSQEVLVVPKSTQPPDQPAVPDVPSSSAEVQSLQQLLKKKTETISSMASEIQALQQKNESLMRAKLRFQQQLQQIRNLPKQRPERSTPEIQVPRISVSLGQDLQSTQGSDSSVPSPQSDEPPFTGSREDLSQAPRVSHHPTSAEDQQRGSFSDEGAGQMPPGPRSALVPAVAPTKSFSLELIPPPQSDSEGALLSPRGSALLSPRPFVPPRPWSPFKFRGNPELPENSEKH